MIAQGATGREAREATEASQLQRDAHGSGDSDKASVATQRFEAMTAEALGTEHAVAFAFARHGLMAILAGLDMGPGDEVVLPPLTCKVVPTALLAAGVTPVYADIDRDTLNLTASEVERVCGPRTKAILFQHTYGRPDGIDDVAKLAERLGVHLIEDCAQCLPMRENTWRPGTTGIAAVFSNNLGKPLSVGSGGVAVTHNAELAARLRAWRRQLGQRGAMADALLRVSMLIYRVVLRPERYWTLFDAHRKLSAGYRVRSVDSEIKSAITKTMQQPSHMQMLRGTRGMDQVRAWAEHRRRCCAMYLEGLRGTDLEPLRAIDPSAPLYYFPVLVPRKGGLLAKARRRKIEVIPWPISTPIYPVEREAELETFGYRPGTSPVAEGVARELVGLPTHLHITPAHQRALIGLLLEHASASS
jgi:dTDP-4-amino-4,6-dideoxygalactose transaminase